MGALRLQNHEFDPNVRTLNIRPGAPVLRLETFGGARLAYMNGPPAQQRRRVALFTLLATVGDRGITREKLVGYLWPDSTIVNARHSLEQLLYGVRRSFGDDILSKGNPVTVSSGLFSSDVQDFESAVSRNDLELAASLYRGPFLDGFFLPDAPEFERWATTESQRLADVAGSVFEQLAARASAMDDSNQLIQWLRKRVALDPLSAHATLLLMNGLASAGDTTSAVQQAATYERLVRQELQSEPDPSVTALAAALRETAPTQQSNPAKRTPTVKAEETAASMPPHPLSVSSGVPAQERRRQWRFIALSAAAAITVAAAAYFKPSRNAPPVTRSLVAVLPFKVNVSDSSLAYLGEGVMDLLSARFTGEGGPSSVDPRAVLNIVRGGNAERAERYSEIARSTGATEIVEGEIIQTSSNDMTLNARVISVRTRDVISTASTRGMPDSVAILVDRLANRLLAARAGEEAPRVTSMTTASPLAVAAFLQGRAEYRRSQVSRARELFVKALDHDSTFAAAALQLALATGKLFQWNTVTVDTVRRTRGVGMGGLGSNSEDMQWQRGLQIAIRDSAKLSRRDRILLAALRGGYPRTVMSARQILANWENAVQALPDLPDTHAWLGHVLLFQGPAMGLRDARVRSNAEFRRALAIDLRFTPAIRGLIEAAALEGDTVALRSLRQRYLAVDGSSDEAKYIIWRVATMLRDSATRRIIRRELPLLNNEIVGRIRFVAQLEAEALEDAEAANTVLLSRAGSSQDRQFALHAARQLHLNRGRIREAAAAAAMKREVEPNSDLQRGYAIRDALFWDAEPSIAAESALAFDTFLDSLPANAAETRRSSYMRFSSSLWRIMRGDTARVASDIARLRSSPFGADGRADVLDAALADRVRRPDGAIALAKLDSLASLGFGSTPHIINLVSARIHERRGDVRGALAAVRRGIWYFPPENLTTYLREEGRLALATGDSTAAIGPWSRYLRLRSAPDSRLRAQVDSIRLKLSHISRNREHRN